MSNSIFILLISSCLCFMSCNLQTESEKGFPTQSTESTPQSPDETPNGIQSSNKGFKTRPSNVLLTSIPLVRLTPIYKVNYEGYDSVPYIGSNTFHDFYIDSEEFPGNNWNRNLMPGIEAVYGLNMINVSLFDIQTGKQKLLFEKPVLIKTLYYPAFSSDTLNSKPIARNFCMVSVYNDDTNRDGFINLNDLRRFYLFDMNGNKIKALIPENYSVIKSEYDLANDYMYVFAQIDTNKNGQVEAEEDTHIFFINLANPSVTGKQYE